MTYTADSSLRQIILSNSITSYKDANLPARLIFSTIKNPPYVKPITDMTDMSDSFSIMIKDSNGYSIASIQTGVYYTATAGSIDSVITSVDNSVVNSVT